MADVIGLCNRSLLGIGARATISSISPSDGSTAADACSILYTPTFEALARTAKWNCLRKQTKLTLVQAAQGTPENPNGTTYPLPPTPWVYAYLVPSDSLFVRSIVPSFPPNSGTGPSPTTYNNAAQTWLPNNGAIPYQVAYGNDINDAPIELILTNQPQAQAVYTVNQPNPVIWDSMFQQAFVNSLGAFLVPALALNFTLMNIAIKGAEAIIAQARAADGNEGTVSQDHTPDWIRIRGGSSGAYWWDGGNIGGTYYGNMNWPSC